MHKQGIKFERRKVVVDAEGFERTGASLIVSWILGFVACGLTHEAASEHTWAQACVTAYTHVCTYSFRCTCVCFRAHVRASMCSSIHSCAHACFQAHVGEKHV